MTSEQKSLKRFWASSPLAFIDTLCYTYDPRLQGDKVVPFKLFDFQRQDILSFEQGLKDGGFIGYEKSRGMGLSWLVATWSLYHWLFDEEPFTIDMGSNKVGRVDTKGNLDTLFEKIRFNLYRLPEWLLPKGFSRSEHDNYCRIVNPATGSVISGDPPGEFARSGRYSVIFADEFAHWPNQQSAIAAFQQAAAFKVIGSTPCGKEEFYRITRSEYVKLISRHWSEHPQYAAGLYYDEDGKPHSPWYDKQCQEISVDWIIAQELDISYDRSIGNRVYEEFDRRRNVYEYRPENFEGCRHVWFWDFGVSDETAILRFRLRDGELWGCGEVIGREAGAEEWALHLDKHYPEGKAAEHIGDPSGAARESDLSSWYSRFAARGYRITAPPYGSQMDRLSNVKRLLKAGKLHFDDKLQPRLIDALEGWSWKTIKTSAGFEIAIDKPMHDVHSHPGTALYYGCWELYNPLVLESYSTPLMDKPRAESAFLNKMVSGLLEKDKGTKNRPSFGGKTGRM